MVARSYFVCKWSYIYGLLSIQMYLKRIGRMITNNISQYLWLIGQILREFSSFYSYVFKKKYFFCNKCVTYVIRGKKLLKKKINPLMCIHLEHEFKVFT